MTVFKILVKLKYIFETEGAETVSIMYNNCMIRYLAQPANTNICGPVAIINIMKFFGFNASSKHLSFVKYKCRYENGVDASDITTCLREFSTLKFFIRNEPTVRLINRHLKRNGAVIIISVIKEKEEVFGHCWIITDKENDKYVCHNYQYKSTEYITQKELQKILNTHHDDMPKAWFVSQR